MRKILLLTLLSLAWSKEINPGEFLLEHVLDSHNWHITDIPWGKNPDGSTHYLSLSLPLPWIVYHAERGLEVFFLSGHTTEELQQAARQKGYTFVEGKITALDCMPTYDLSLSKTAFHLLLIGLLLLGVLGGAARTYPRHPNAPPRGIARLLEPIILFIRDEVVRPNLKEKTPAFTPYLLTIFFFIWFSNLFGLTPLNSNIMGNITLTFMLALLSFILIQFNGSKDYWLHIFAPPIPKWLYPIMIPVEIISLFARPFALMIRLFANISAGHFVLLSLVGLIFLLSKGESLVVGLSVAPLSIAFALFVMTIEMLVAVLQAYIFTLLTAVFIGMAMEESHQETTS
ncbi:MAG: F0F1 ATP synthase subunit A [Bacteroidia bacterium]